MCRCGASTAKPPDTGIMPADPVSPAKKSPAKAVPAAKDPEPVTEDEQAVPADDQDDMENSFAGLNNAVISQKCIL